VCWSVKNARSVGDVLWNAVVAEEWTVVEKSCDGCGYSRVVPAT
jgi:hypothetical protein